MSKFHSLFLMAATLLVGGSSHAADNQLLDKIDILIQKLDQAERDRGRLSTQIKMLEDRMKELADNSGIDALNSLPKGIVVFWGSPDGTIPQGWRQCANSGSKYVRLTLSLADAGTIGGSSKIVGGKTDGHVLSIDQIPRHRHAQVLSGGVGSGWGYTHVPNQYWGLDAANIGGRYTDFEGGDEGHSHDLPTWTNTPEYLSLACMIKIN